MSPYQGLTCPNGQRPCARGLYLYNFELINILFEFVVLLICLVRIIVELLRLPFDFYEGESELVSEFNIEYGSLIFLILFKSTSPGPRSPRVSKKLGSESGLVPIFPNLSSKASILNPNW